MKPILLNKTEDKQIIQEALLKFYKLRPTSYGLNQRSQGEYEEYVDLIERYVKNKKGKLLELGCGTWRIPETLANRNFQDIVGLDVFSENDLKENIKHITSKNVQLLTYDGYNLPFSDNTFDVISSLCVFEHIMDVEKTLSEIHRVLKPGGMIIIKCPNWSGINNPVMGLYSNVVLKRRYWQYENVKDSVGGIIRSMAWYFAVLFTRKSKFILVRPRIKDNEIDFEKGDDDAVHLCQPYSIKKWFKRNKYTIILYNRYNGNSKIAKIFNTILPSLSTTNNIVVKKLKL